MCFQMKGLFLLACYMRLTKKFTFDFLSSQTVLFLRLLKTSTSLLRPDLMSVFRQWSHICSVSQVGPFIFYFFKYNIFTLDIVDFIQKCFTISFQVVTVQKCPIQLSQLSIQLMQMLIQYFGKFSFLSCLKRNLLLVSLQAMSVKLWSEIPVIKWKDFIILFDLLQNTKSICDFFCAVNSHKSVNHLFKIKNSCYILIYMLYSFLISAITDKKTYPSHSVPLTQFLI